LKALVVGGFKLPRVDANAGSMEMRASELAMILDGIDMTKLNSVPCYERPVQHRVNCAEKVVA
jgi:hypothetical protein